MLNSTYGSFGLAVLTFLSVSKVVDWSCPGMDPLCPVMVLVQFEGDVVKFLLVGAEGTLDS